MDILIIILGVAFVIMLYNSQQKKSKEKMIAEFEEHLRKNPALTSGIPVFSLEEVKTTSGEVIFLAYEDFSRKFVCQDMTVEGLITKIHNLYPSEPVLFARDVNEKEYYELVKQ